MPIWSDVRGAARALLRDRSYTAIALLTLSFGIAANTIIFSLVDGVLLRPLAYRDPARLGVVNEVIVELAGQYPRLPASARHCFEWRDHATSFEAIGIADSARYVLT